MLVASPGAAQGRSRAHVAQRGQAVAQHQLGEPHVGQLRCVVARQEHVGRLHQSQTRLSELVARTLAWLACIAQEAPFAERRRCKGPQMSKFPWFRAGQRWGWAP